MGKTSSVFISYSHDSDAHRHRVLALSDWLNKKGLDCDIDQYVDGSPPEGWPLWMEHRLEQADHVLVVCTQTYLARVKRTEKRGVGKGVKWESLLTYQAIYDDDGLNRKFIPLIFTAADRNFIPKPLRAVSHYDLSDENSYAKLLRHLTGQPVAIKPALGKTPHLPPLNAADDEQIITSPPRLKSPSIPLWQRVKKWLLLFMFLALLTGVAVWYWWQQQQALPVGETLLEQGEYLQAQRECEAAPESAARDRCLRITGLMLEQRDVDQFYAAAQQEDSAYALAVMGEAAAYRQDFASAEQHYREAIRRNPAIAQAYFGIGQIRQEQNQLTEALDWYQQAAERAPQNRRFRLNLASAYAEQGGLQQAEDNYRKVLATDNSVLLAYVELIDVLLRQNKTTQAAELATEAERGLADNPDWKDKPLNAQEWQVIQDGETYYLQNWEQKQDYLQHWFSLPTSSGSF